MSQLKIFKVLFLTAFILVPSSSFANLDGFKLNFVAAFVNTDEECSAEGEITSDQGGLINGTEQIAVNGTTWGDLSSLPTSGYSIGDKISFGTDPLALRLGVSFDVQLDTAICKGLKVGDSIEFFGSFGAQLTQLTIPQPGLNTAWALNSGGTYDEVDLTQNSLWGTSLNGGMWTLGTGPLFGSGGGGMTMSGNGCRLGNSAAASSMSMVWFLFTAIFGLGWLWLRREAILEKK